MDTTRKYDEDDDELEGYNGDYDDPSLDIYCTNLARSEEKEWKRKERMKQERKMK